ncbi:sensor domain-containing diguanylate cyclase [Lacimicrobium alkaliphilum]|uniref:diguanylate cyclase n=1 Tax=Lacimicrobium alkaliphilum TaxID=1526571 RepID=A0ABQ1RIS4_9ALTE|nr:diguanylate cyclase [Lacimicrobium alkaliphilum]GGD67985.1 hypothetical protein GCM10011357_23860 [Lacimicrobium alkaliphilum]
MPLRLVIIIPFTLLFTLATAIISGILLYNNHAASREAAQQSMVQYTDSMADYVSGLVAPLHQIVRVNRDALSNGSLDIHRPASLAAPLLRQMRLYKHLTFISVASTDGRYIASARDPDSQQPPHLAVNFISSNAELGAHRPTEQDLIGQRITQLPPYDPRQRPFYISAIHAHPDISWGNISRYIGFPVFGLGVSATITNEEGEILGVSATGMALTQISDFLASLVAEDRGYAFIAESDGTLVATSAPDMPLTSAEDDTHRLKLSAHPSPLLQTIGKLTQQQQISESIDISGELYLLNLQKLELGFGNSWWLGVVIPEQTFTSAVIQSTYRAVTLIVLMLVLITLVGFYLAHSIASPISKIASLAQSGSLSGLQSLPQKNTLIREVTYLSDTVRSLASELQKAITELESRVKKRTAALRKANLKLKKQSRQDGLTGIANRRTFDETIDQEWKRAVRHRHPLSMIIADIDYFKSFNDHYGHQKGDDALKAVAKALDQQPQRPGETVCRYGGEEFAVILPQTDEQGATEMAEKMRQAIIDLNLERDDIDEHDRVTLSLGIATIIPDNNDKVSTLFKQADRRLYQAKEAGRNRTKTGKKDS